MGQILFHHDHEHVIDGVKEQASCTTRKIYSLINMEGGGRFLTYMKQAKRSKNYARLDQQIQQELAPFVYNNGLGTWFHVKDLVRLRAGLDHPAAIPGKVMTDEQAQKKKDQGHQYKKLCWKLDEMGAVGETALHVCLLNATATHVDLAKRLIYNFPALVNDIYISDVYFGESILHMAIVDEDPAMVRYLLEYGCDVQQRAVGCFFTADDQKKRRKDNFQTESYDLPLKTNYYGPTYWGEYPLGFAACLGQEECVRLLIAKGADPNAQDSNGCTVLHMIVVQYSVMEARSASWKDVYTHPKDMFDLLVSLGANIHVVNRQLLTPFTLAAKLAQKEMFEHILELERKISWIYGRVTCASYPLEYIDTIATCGGINTHSAMYQIIFGEHHGHMEMVNEMMQQLLIAKWTTFAKSRLIVQFLLFLVYFTLFLVTTCLHHEIDYSQYDVYGTENLTLHNGTVVQINVTTREQCYLTRWNTAAEHTRQTAELCVVIGAFLYLLLCVWEIYNQGVRIFFLMLNAAPSRALFHVSNCFVIMAVPARYSCHTEVENIICMLAILSCAPYFLFFCRGLHMVGPFVLMIYKMIVTDMLRFFAIYMVFLVGFSQGMYVLLQGDKKAIFYTPSGAIQGMFLISLKAFSTIYDTTLSHVDQAGIYSPNVAAAIEFVSKVMFLVYMVFVALLLMNMLIAMMTNTYQRVSEVENEWLRQWAQIILILEQTLSHDFRKKKQIAYSQPMSNNQRAFVIRWNQTESEHERLKEEADKMKVDERSKLQRNAIKRWKSKRQHIATASIALKSFASLCSHIGNENSTV